MSAPRSKYDHKVGCSCPWCHQIDAPNWYGENSEYMINLNAFLRKRPESGSFEPDPEDLFYDY